MASVHLPGAQPGHRQRGRNYSDRQSSGKRPDGAAHRLDFLLQRSPVIEDRVRAFQDPLTLRREPVESLTAFDDRNAQLLLELPNAAGERWLRDVTRVRRAGEVLLTRQRNEVLELADIHAVGRLQAR